MSFSPKDVFDAEIDRANHLLTLYDLLHDSRQRGIRSDWARKMCDTMRWPKSENITRIDGKDKSSILVLREELGLTRNQFKHRYVSELLRATIATSVSAMDRYFHDKIVEKSLKLLSRKEQDIPKELKNLRLPVIT